MSCHVNTANACVVIAGCDLNEAWHLPYTVTFLALGNGAPDISSSVAAITAGNYLLAISSLLGGTPAVSQSQMPFTCVPGPSCLMLDTV